MSNRGDRERTARAGEVTSNLVMGAAFIVLGVMCLGTGWLSGPTIGWLWLALGLVRLLQGWWARRSLAVARSTGELPPSVERGRAGWILAGSAVVAMVLVLETSGVVRGMAGAWLVLLVVAMAVWSSPLCDRWTMRPRVVGQRAS